MLSLKGGEKLEKLSGDAPSIAAMWVRSAQMKSLRRGESLHAERKAASRKTFRLHPS